MKIKKFNEFEHINESVVEFDESQYMTAGHLVDYLRKNVPMTTLIFHSYPDQPMVMIEKERMMDHMPKIEDIFIYEYDDKGDLIDEFGKYRCIEKNENLSSSSKQHLKNKEPKIVKGLYLNKYL